jgi:hypothetical protein
VSENLTSFGRFRIDDSFKLLFEKDVCVRHERCLKKRGAIRTHLGGSNMIRRTAKAAAGLRGILIVLAVCCAGAAQAAPITFTFSASNVSGTLGIHQINNQTLVVTATADTADVQVNPCGFADLVIYQASCVAGSLTGSLTGLFTLGGFSGSFDDLLYVFNNQSNDVVGFGTNGADILDLQGTGAALGTYGLVSSFGPITGSVYYFELGGFGTSLGYLTLDPTSSTQLGFQAVGGGGAVAVPEPDGLPVFGLGLLAMIGLGWACRKHAHLQREIAKSI